MPNKKAGSAGKKVSSLAVKKKTNKSEPPKPPKKAISAKKPAPKKPAPKKRASATTKTSPKKQAAAVVAKPPSGQWACFACTLFNPQAQTACEACGTYRGFAVDGEGNGEVQAEKYLEFSDGKSNKFWKLSIQGCTTKVTFGRIGTPGQTDTKVHNNEAAARKFADKIEAEKMRKGYA